MANKQSLPKVNVKGAELRQMVQGVPLIKYVKHEHDDLGSDFETVNAVLGVSKAVITHQQKRLKDDAKRMEAAALLNTYRQGLVATKTFEDFDILADGFDDFMKADFEDDESKVFWQEHGQNILDANKEDTEKLREIKSVEFGKNSLNQLLADAQNMIALAPDGGKYLEMGGEEIAQSVFLTEAEKEKYQYNFYKNGILNLALQDADAAEVARAKYLTDDEELKDEIKKISELRLKAIEQQQQEQQKREDFAAQKEAVSLWQRKQTGALDEASYYVLAKGVGARFGDEENAKGNITEAYQVLKRLNEGEKLFDEEIFAANQALISAYDEGKAGFEEVVFAQNFLFDKEGQNNRGVDRAINELMDRVMLPDAEDESLEAEAFMEEKAKLALQVSEAYYARKNDLIHEAKAQGKTISLGVLNACARKAMHEVCEMFDFDEDEEGISFAELENELEENYPNADKAVVWKEFAKRAPYAKDKEKLFQRLAETNIGTRYAENEYAGVMSDAMVEKPFDEENFVNNVMKQVIQEHEGIYMYPYVDTADKTTVGPGLNINNGSKNIEWWYRNPKTGEMRLLDKNKAADNQLIEEELKKLDKYKHQNNNKAEFFEDKTNLRITENHAHQLYLKRVNQAMNDIRDLIKTHNENRNKKIDDFEKLPEPLQIVLVDMVYNLGYEGFYWEKIKREENGNEVKNGYPRFWKALENLDLDGMIKESKRYSGEIPLEKRNQNIRKMLENLRDYFEKKL